MNISRFRHYKPLLLLCLVVAATSGCSSFLARAAQSRSFNALTAKAPGRGLRVLNVYPNSQAEHVGLTQMDVLFRYGDFEVVDDASFFAARDFYEKKGGAEIPILVWRGGAALEVKVRPGKLGLESNEYSPVAYQFGSFMDRLDVQQGIPEHLRAVEFKDAYTPPERLRAEANQLLDKAELEGTLTPNQILVGRIYMIDDEAPPEELKRQAEMLAQLIATQPVSYLEMLGNDKLFKKEHYRAAAACLKRYLEVVPDDVSMRLNMGVSYYKVGMFAEAEAAADYVFDHQLPLSDHGLVVAFDVKAMGALARSDYQVSIKSAEQAFTIEPHPFDIFLIMLAAAQTGDVQKVMEASGHMERTLPQEFKRDQLKIAAVEALALVKNNQRNQARELVNKWKDTDRAEGRIKSWWKIFPGSAELLKNWNELARS
jgi:tetratricopeptide (TPR) repeat protein